MDLKEEEALGEAVWRHWYYVSKARMMTDVVGPARAVLDVGAGSGFFSRWMLRQGLAVRATCVDPGYAEETTDEIAGRPISFVRQLDQSDADVVLMMDVLEHVDDDVGLLAQYLALTPPGGSVLITVPAFEFIWSAHDDFLDHRRRYTLSRLSSTITAAGGRMTQGHYYFGLIFPLAACARLLGRLRRATRSDMRPTPEPVNTLLTWACAAERRVMRWNRIAGLSVVAVCTHADDASATP